MIRQFKGDISSAVFLRVDGGHILVKGLQSRHCIAVSIHILADIGQLCTHGIVVVIDGSLGVETVLFLCLVILGVELHATEGGCLKVDGQGEGEDVLLIGLQTTVIIVHITGQGDGVGGVVGEVILGGIEFDLDVGRIDGAAVTIRLTDVHILTLENHFAGGIVGNDGLNALGIPQQAGPDETQCVNGALLVGQGDMGGICGDIHILGILQEVVAAQVADIVTGQAADGTGSVGVSLGLVFLGNALVHFVRIGVEVGQVKHGSLGPVAVVCQVRHIQADVGTLLSLQGDVAFHVHAVFEGGIQVSLVLLTEGQGQLYICLAFAVHLQPGAVELAALHGGDLNGCTLQDIGLFCDGGLTGVGQGLADAFGHNISADIVGQALGAEVLHGEGHFIDTGLFLVITQLQLGLVHYLTVSTISGDVGRGLDGAHQVGKACTLLSDGIGLAVGTQSNVSGGHQQLVDHGIDCHIVICNVGEILHHILPQQDDDAGQVGAGHGGAGEAVIAAAGDGGQNVAAVAGDLRLDIQAGGGTPGREVGNERTGGLALADLQLAVAGSNQHLAVVLGNGADCQFSVAHIHLDFTGHIIIDNDAGCALCLGDQSLLLEGVVTTANQNDLAGDIHAGVVSASADAGDDHVIHLHGFLVTQQGLAEFQRLCSSIVGLIKVDNSIAVHQVGSLHTVDGCNGQNAIVSTGRTNRAGIGVGGQAQVTVGLGTVSGRIAVGSGNHNADAGGTELVIDTVEQFFLRLTAKAAGGTQGHIDDINTQNHTVFQSRQNPGCPGSIHDIGEDLHGHQLCIGGNTSDHIVVADNNAGNVGTVVIVGRVNVGVVVGVVVTEGNLLVDVDIVNTQAAVEFIGLGLLDNSCHILIGHAQLLRGEVLHGEGSMVGVQAGIQNRNNHAAAVVAGIAALEDACLINADRVLYQLGLTGPVDFTDDGLVTIAQGLAGNIIIAGLDQNFKTAGQGLVIFTQLIGNSLIIQSRQDPLLFAGDLLADSFSLLAALHILGKADRLVALLVGIHQADHIHGNDNRNLFLGCFAVSQAECNRVIQVLRIVSCQRIVQLLDISRLVGGSCLLCCCHCGYSRHGTRKDRRCQQQRRHHPGYLHKGILVHVFFPFSCVFLPK